MTHHVYKTIELVGSSPVGIEDAVNHALGKASLSLRNLRWLELGQIRGEVNGAKVANWQVTFKLGFTLEE